MKKINFKPQTFKWPFPVAVELLLRLVCVLFVFIGCKLVFYFCNQLYFNTPSGIQFLTMFIASLRFDWAAVIYINVVFILSYFAPGRWLVKKVYQKFQLILYLFFNGLAIAFEVIDIGFFAFSFKRLNGSDLQLMQNTAGMGGAFLKEYWLLLLFFFALMTFLYLWFYKTKIIKSELTVLIQRYPFFLIFSLLFFIISARGGIQYRPLLPIAASEFVDDMQWMPLVSNTTLNLLFSLKKKPITEPAFYPIETLKKKYPITHYPDSTLIPRKTNVIILVLESFGKDAIGFLHNNESYTPFLDSLLPHAYLPEYCYANGLRSTQGIAAITTGIPALMEDPLMFSAYQSNQVEGLAYHLGQIGYETAFFHGSNPGSMDFEQFAILTGFQKIHDREDYENRYPEKNDYDGQWGIWDVPFLQYSLEQINEMKQPFFNLIFTLTSHHPYKVEHWFEHQFPIENKVFQSIRYTDFAVQTFFEAAAKMPWFDNTLFIITADHIGVSTNPLSRTRQGRYQIPIAFYKAGETFKNEYLMTAQQIDIMPTILDYLNYNRPYNTIGNSIFSNKNVGEAYMYNDGIYQMIDGQHLLLFNGEKSIGLFDYKGDPYLHKDRRVLRSGWKVRMEKKLKAVIQWHHRNTIYNEWHVEHD